MLLLVIVLIVSHCTLE